MIALIFDTETNGFKRKYAKGPSLADKQGRVIQLAWEVVQVEDGQLISQHSKLIKPDGWAIPHIKYFMAQGQSEEKARQSAKFWLDHGFNTFTSQREGIPMPEVLAAFILDVNQADLLVGHNVAFDKAVLSAEMIRYRMRAAKRLPTFCTMNGVKMGPKKLKLADLYQVLFNQPFAGAHNAQHDVTATRLCLVEMVRRGFVDLKNVITCEANT